MRKAIKFISKMALAALTVAGVSGLTAPEEASAWGPSRPDYTIEQIEAGAIPENGIIFNSISDSEEGEEKNFVGAREYTGINAGIYNQWEHSDITVENGKEYIIRVYVHNNNPNGYDRVSENTRVAFDIPQYSAKDIEVNGFIFSDNSVIHEYWDYVRFHSNNSFHLEYVEGSALLENNGIGANGGLTLSDNIVKKAASENGVQIGYDALDGRIPGCYQFSSFVTIRVKAVYDTEYTVSQKVRLAGTKDWLDSVEAKVGDKVEFQVEYKNTSKVGETQNDVMVKDILAKNLKYVPNTTRIWNAGHSGAYITPDGDLFTSGINIANYKPGANAFVRFTAEVVDNSLAEGSNTIVNWTQVGAGKVTMQDYATVHVTKAVTTPTPDPVVPDPVIPEPVVPEPVVPTPDVPETPEEPTTMPSTGPAAVAGTVLAAGSMVTAGGYYIASRRRLH